MQAPGNPAPARRVFARILLLALSALYLAAAWFAGYGEWLAKHPTSGNLALGRRWMSANPALDLLYGRSQLLSLRPEDLQGAATAFRESLVWNPFDAVAWDELATVRARLGETGEQERALRAAVTAFPHSPAAHWSLANFLLQQGRQQEAFPFLRAAAGDDPALRIPEFELGWKLLADPRKILDDLVPDDLESRMLYLSYLVWTKGAVQQAYPVWQKIFSDRTGAVVQLGQSYTEALARAGFGEEASHVWAETWPADAGETSSAAGGELVINGSFEKPLRNAGLDWRIGKGPGYQASLDDFEAQDGSRSLRVQFDGTANPEFNAVQQWVPVEPGREYHFQAYLKTENISTDNGMFLSIFPQGAQQSEFWERTTAVRVGTIPWTEEQLDVRTGPDTRVLLLQLRRQRSAKLDNLLRGAVWLDHVSLTSRPD